jgi:hypothetical protein
MHALRAVLPHFLVLAFVRAVEVAMIRALFLGNGCVKLRALELEKTERAEIAPEKNTQVTGNLPAGSGQGDAFDLLLKTQATLRLCSKPTDPV